MELVIIKTHIHWHVNDELIIKVKLDKEDETDLQYIHVGEPTYNTKVMIIKPE